MSSILILKERRKLPNELYKLQKTKATFTTTSTITTIYSDFKFLQNESICLIHTTGRENLASDICRKKAEWVVKT